MIGTTFTIPEIETERLILRAPTLDDLGPYTDIMASERSVHMGGPFTAQDSWFDFCAAVAGWQLHGYGAWTLALRETGEFLGLIFLHHEYGDPERELGWILTPEAEGHGYAFEAASAARDFAFETLGWDRVISYVDPGNDRSIALAEKMGATIDPAATQPPGESACLIYSHRPAGGMDDDLNVEACA